jgi:hypothetical protein
MYAIYSFHVRSWAISRFESMDCYMYSPVDVLFYSKSR